MNFILKTYKEQIEHSLHDKCRLFCMIGFKHESPRWINVDEQYEEDGKFYLKFKSTQCKLFFSIELSESHYKSLERHSLSEYMWNDFKEFRTKFLIENYPTINPY